MIEKLEALNYFESYNNFSDVITTWLALLEKYTWAVPSDTRYKFSDVSLFDHLRSSAAFAACLYEYHYQTLSKTKGLTLKNELLFIGGDFSGIQNYIFEITNISSGGAAKRLRARSFFVSMFSEVVIHNILHSLELPFVCNLYSVAGKFVLVAPNIKEIKEQLNLTKEEIENYIHDKYFSQFSFLMDSLEVEKYKTSIKIANPSINKKDINLIYSNFFSFSEGLFHRLETQKLQKSKSVLLSKSKSWKNGAFKADAYYERYRSNDGVSDCKICGKGPGERTDKNENNEDVRVCCNCDRDKEIIGKKLPKTKYIGFGKTKEACDISFFEDTDQSCYYIDLIKEDDKFDINDYYIMYRLNSKEDIIEPKILNKYYANYTPVDDYNNTKDFSAIAKLSLWNKNDDGDNVNIRFGTELLGVLKMDIDNLGLCFNKGFETTTKYEDNIPLLFRKTTSRFLTLSRMLELFLSGFLHNTISNSDIKKRIIKEFIETGLSTDNDKLCNYINNTTINFNNIYTVYSGGDDLVLIGPWETMIIFSLYFHLMFRQYTCNNDCISISAGLAFVKPKEPSSSMIKQADELLTKSKKAGKDRITFFGSTIQWKEMPKILKSFLILNELFENNNIKMSFLYDLLQYNEMAKEYVDEGKKSGIKYIPLLSYNIIRNLGKKPKCILNEEFKPDYSNNHFICNAELNTIEEMLIDFLSLSVKESLLYIANTFVSWVIYRNRKESNALI
ncbi:MAG: type III-A CRISPR-associated protein Cas10/Csm1 [Nitrospirae bacterium]|nr:type III-A CRISPR-associated protein Cas10/Csm1 [Nitrospirota bacterium]